MRFSHWFTRYKTISAPDGQGGLIETPTLPVTGWGHMRINDNLIELHVDPMEDIAVNDQITVSDEQAPPPNALLVSAGQLLGSPSGLTLEFERPRQVAWYRVIENRIVPGTRIRALTLERLTRPMTP